MKGKIVTAMMMVLSLSAFAQNNKDQAPAAPAAKDSDKLDLKKLEDKYWAAKDTDFSVVQNRTYTKAGRPFASISYGTLVNDPYSTGRMTNVSAGYYFSERWGAEISHMTGELENNDATSTYMTQFKVPPNFNKFKSYTSLNGIWVPFYAKMSFLDRHIMYFDMQFAVGVGTKSYDIYRADAQDVSKSALGYNFDFTQQLFFSNHFAVRLDLKNQWSKQERERAYLTTSQTDADRALPENTINDTTFLLGLTFFY